MVIENDVPERELECPDCNALVPVTGLQGYEIVQCPECELNLEYVGTELILKLTKQI